MRDYLYIWNNPQHRFIVASGLEFKDLKQGLSACGIVLIDHQSDTATFDQQSGFHFTASSALPDLMAEDIYSWGNFAWADFAATPLPILPKEEIAELLYFAHKAEPLRDNVIEKLGNNFLGYSHDDGWYLKLFYGDWNKAIQLLNAAIPTSLGSLNMEELQKGSSAIWLRNGRASQEEITHDVDSILNRLL